MVDGPAPSQNATISPQDFHDIACSAGEELKRKLHENFESGTKTPGIVSFEVWPYDAILEKVKTKFASQIFGALHPGSTLEWLKIFVMAVDVPHDDTAVDSAASNEIAAGNRQEDIWLLALYVGEKDTDKIGRSFSLKRKFNVERGAIYLVYKAH